ncbi:reverse transcriptase [Caerostris extrusa]|uniref:Reverse transcriptase n=1 Tax=Caerostris extrusa TaxID=172846 RepID=A0AAV4PU56_CAEEX|nr:reverse transcriptase [Caerostris extrusa]
MTVERQTKATVLAAMQWKSKHPIERRKRVGICCCLKVINPFLLAATLNHHLNQTTKELKEIAEKLQESLYVDNCVASVDSEEELKYFCNESQKLLQSAKFDLRGWKHTKFKETILNQEENEDEVEVPLLGLSWNTVDDTLSCDFRKFKLEDEPITKGKYYP